MLLDEVRGNSTLADIAARHLRSPAAICSQLERLAASGREFPSYEALFKWARTELRTGQAGTLGWAANRADAAAAAGYPALNEPAERVTSTNGYADSSTPPWVRPATDTRRCEVIAIWSSIVASGNGHAPMIPHGDEPEVDVLALSGDARLAQTGATVLRSRGVLSLASWVLECDWPGIEGCDITVAQIRSGDEHVQHAGAELLLAGLGMSRGRNREMMRMRLGFTGEAMTLEAIARRFSLSRERVRQIQDAVLNRAWIARHTGVRRCWHHVHDVLLAALSTPGLTDLDPDLVLSFVELAAPAAPRDVAVTLVARLCGHGLDDSRSLVKTVDRCYGERAQHHEQSLRVEKKRGQLADKVRRLVARAEWPAGPPRPAGGDASPLRSPIAPNRRSASGWWMSDRMGRPVGYDSEAELRVIQTLDLSDDLVVSYCEQPVRISYTLYGERHDYYPDLLVDLSDGHRLLVEVKSRIDEFALYENVTKFKAAGEFCRALGWGFVATTDRIQTPQDLADRSIEPGVEQILTTHLTAGPTDWHHLYPLVRAHTIRYADIATLTLRHGWYWHQGPFRLSTTPLDGDQRWQPVQRTPSPNPDPT